MECNTKSLSLFFSFLNISLGSFIYLISLISRICLTFSQTKKRKESLSFCLHTVTVCYQKSPTGLLNFSDYLWGLKRPDSPNLY